MHKYLEHKYRKHIDPQIGLLPSTISLAHAYTNTFDT